MSKKIKISIGSDHAGFEYKSKLVPYLESKGYAIIDKGTMSTESTDYPDYAHAVSRDVENNAVNFGILLCGSANGVSITANKHQKIRAAICWKIEIAKLARAHNNANIICIPARFVSLALAKKMIDVFLVEKFEGGRHLRRVKKISC